MKIDQLEWQTISTLIRHQTTFGPKANLGRSPTSSKAIPKYRPWTPTDSNRGTNHSRTASPLLHAPNQSGRDRQRRPPSNGDRASGSSARVPRPYPLGRLDRDTSGFLLLTDNGPLGFQLLHPQYHVERSMR
ncbi:MAG: pseudouridine synthase [Streptococcus sp.]